MDGPHYEQSRPSHHIKATLADLAKKNRKKPSHLPGAQHLVKQAPAHHIGGFFPHLNNPMLALVGARKKLPIVLPRFNSRTQQYEWAHYTGSLEKGPFGILEPPPTADAAPPPNWCWVPAVGVDNNGGRLGWGHGFYDRLLNPHAMHRVGVVFHCQRVPHIPCDPWDVTLTDIICETTPG